MKKEQTVVVFVKHRERGLMLMTGKGWLIVVIVLAIIVGIGVPLLGSIIRSRDFKEQAEGRKPVRQLDEKKAVLHEIPRKHPELESTKYIAELKSKQNILGPK